MTPPPENELTTAVKDLRKVLEKILEHLQETQEANMRMLNNVLKEAHENDRDGDV